MDLDWSCFRRVVVKEHLSLLPYFVGNTSKGIIEKLNCKILKYSTDLNGVLLGYSNITLIQEMGKIMDEQPHIHFDVKYTACIFRPVMGSVLCGKVNKVGSDHVGCLLYDCFNVTVVSKGTNWHDDNSFFPFDLEGGSKIWFKVVSLDITGDILSLTGDFIDIGNA